jgi:hypothetical protein
MSDYECEFERVVPIIFLFCFVLYCIVPQQTSMGKRLEPELKIGLDWIWLGWIENKGYVLNEF